MRWGTEFPLAPRATVGGVTDVAIEEFLRAEGYGHPETLRAARAVLEEAGLTRAAKTRMSAAKLERARTALEERLAVVCPAAACVTWAQEQGRTAVSAATPTDCRRCSGSSNVSAARDFVAACATRGIRRLVFVGGSPDIHREMPRLLAPLEVRMVDGTLVRPSAGPDLRWADLVIVLGSSELHHKVSTPYMRGPARSIVISRRGIAGILRELMERLR